MATTKSSPPQRVGRSSRASDKLRSISRHALRAFSRHRSTTVVSSDSSNFDLASSPGASPPIYIPDPPSAAAVKSQNLSSFPRNLLPRSATFSNLPRPTTASKAVVARQNRLPSSHSSATLAKSRIPTPCPKSSPSTANICGSASTIPTIGPELIMPTMPLSSTGLVKQPYVPIRQRATQTDDGMEVLKQFTPKSRKTVETNIGRRRHTEFFEKKDRLFSLGQSRDAVHGVDGNWEIVKPELRRNHDAQQAASKAYPAKSAADISSPAKNRSSHEVVHHQLLKGVNPVSPATSSEPRDSFEAKRSTRVGRGTPVVHKSPEKVRAVSSFVGQRTLVEQKSPEKARAIGKPLVSILKPSKQTPAESYAIDLEPSKNRSDIVSPPDRSTASASPDIFGVYESQPSAYWTGRFMSMSDRFKFESISNIPAPCAPDSNKTMIAMELDMATGIFATLEAACRTPAASDSLWRFKRAYATKHHMPQLLKPGPMSPPTTTTEDTTINPVVSSQTTAKKVPAGVDAAKWKVKKSESGSSEDSAGQVVVGEMDWRGKIMERLVGKGKRGTLSLG